MRSAEWQSRLDTALAVAACGAIVGVALQTLGSGTVADIGWAINWVVWAMFVADVAVMLAISPDRPAWIRGHLPGLAVIVVSCPLWALLAYDLLLAELVPSLTILQATKLAKLIHVVRIHELRGLATRVPAGLVLVAAAAVAVAVIAH
jgi:hypothetical protein